LETSLTVSTSEYREKSNDLAVRYFSFLQQKQQI
jgi:hypothetical protein